MTLSGDAARIAMKASAVIVALTLAAPAVAQVFKCVDKGGHTTYQQSPCTGGQQGGTVKLEESVTNRASGGGNEAIWSAAAREQRAVVGMPKHFVTEALGSPGEIRAPRSGEAGSEVWVYSKAGQTTRLGFLNNTVAWMRGDSPAPEARPAVPSATGSPDSDREARVRNALAVGKTCMAALQDAGPPDREEPLSAGTFSGARYVYQFDQANANALAAFVCLNGRVTSVERYVPASR